MKAMQFAAGAALGAMLGVGGGYYFWHGPPAAASPPEGDAPHAPAAAAVEPGRVELDDATVQRLGIATAPLQATSLVPTFAAPGRLQADPSFAGAVRTPLPGRLTAGPTPLPQLGAAVTAGAVVAMLVPRLTATEGADFVQRRAQAVADRDTAIRAADAAQRELDRQRALHADGNAASQRAVEQAEVELATQTARLAAAQQVLQALPEVGPAGVALTAPRDGIVDAVLLHLGEDVDAGTVLLQLSDPSHLLVRVELPAGAPVDPAFVAARVELPGAVPRTLDAARVGWIDGGAGDRAVLLSLAAPDASVRPGLPVIAHLPRQGGEQQGVLLPEAAILRRGDGAWVFVRESAAGGKVVFRRRPVHLTAPAASGWLMTAHEGAPAAGAELVIEGAGALLSVERQRATDAEAGG